MFPLGDTHGGRIPPLGQILQTVQQNTDSLKTYISAHHEIACRSIQQHDAQLAMFAEAAKLQSRGLEQFLASQEKADLHIREIVGLDLKALAREKQAELGEEEMERTEPMLRNYVHALADFVEAVGGRETQSQNGELNVAASVATIKKAEVKPRVWRGGRELPPLTIITFSDERTAKDFDTVFGLSRTVKFQEVNCRIRLRKTRPQARRNDFEWAFELGVRSQNADTRARAQGILSRDDPITNMLHTSRMYCGIARMRESFPLPALNFVTQ